MHKEVEYKGKIVKVFYNCFGFPDFTAFVPQLGSGDNLLEGRVDINVDNLETNDGSQDFKNAYNALEAKCVAKGIPIQKKGDNVIINGDVFTWHHHENGKTMILVPQVLHASPKHYGVKALVIAGLKGRLPDFKDLINCN